MSQDSIKYFITHTNLTPSLAYDVRAASNLNSRRLRDASAASAAPDLMNRVGVGGSPTGGHRGSPGGDRMATASSARISDARVAQYIGNALCISVHSDRPVPT